MSIDHYFGPPSLYYGDLPPPIVDLPHERPHPHQTLFQYLTHRKPHLQPVIIQPDVDIRDTISEFVIEVELPGIGDKNAIKIEWTSSRNLWLEGNIDRPFVPDKQPDPAVLKEHLKTGTRDADGDWIPPPNTEPVKPILVVGERKIGPFRRYFTFPVDVNMEELKAKLESGLLMIRLPKKHVDGAASGRVHIE